MENSNQGPGQTCPGLSDSSVIVAPSTQEFETTRSNLQRSYATLSEHCEHIARENDATQRKVAEIFAIWIKTSLEINHLLGTTDESIAGIAKAKTEAERLRADLNAANTALAESNACLLIVADNYAKLQNAVFGDPLVPKNPVPSFDESIQAALHNFASTMYYEGQEDGAFVKLSKEFEEGNIKADKFLKKIRKELREFRNRKVDG